MVLPDDDFTQEDYTPVPDNPAGANIPYRGVVDHGVPVQQEELPDEAHYWTGRPVEYLPEETEPDPIPVRVVNQGARELRRFSATQPVLSFSNGNAVQQVRIAGRDENRTKLLIRVIGRTDFLQSVFVYIGGPGVTPYDGYLMTNNQELPLNTTEEVWAYADTTRQPNAIPAGIDVLLSVVQEFSEAVK